MSKYPEMDEGLKKLAAIFNEAAAQISGQTKIAFTKMRRPVESAFVQGYFNRHNIALLKQRAEKEPERAEQLQEEIERLRKRAALLEAREKLKDAFRALSAAVESEPHQRNTLADLAPRFAEATDGLISMSFERLPPAPHRAGPDEGAFSF